MFIYKIRRICSVYSHGFIELQHIGIINYILVDIELFLTILKKPEQQLV
jgi:hypothetical protein